MGGDGVVVYIEVVATCGGEMVVMHGVVLERWYWWL